MCSAFWNAHHGSTEFAERIQEYSARFCRAGRLPPPLINGHDVMGRGVQGPRIKTVLQKAYILQLLNPQWDKEQVLAQALDATNA